MAFIIETPNPFQPLTDMKKHVHPGGITIRQWLQQTYPGFVEFERPTICLVNGEPVLRKDWDREIGPNDIVNFIGVVGEIITIIALIVAVVSIAITVALALSLPSAENAPTSDPVYSIKGQSNQIRLGEPIEVCYGKNRIYPSYASRPYTRYIDNDQYLYSLFCLGQGYYEIHEMRIGDAPTSSYEEVTTEVIPPGGTVTLFKTNVYTSPDVGGQKLYAPNQPDYPLPDGWVGPFAASAAGDQVTQIELDFVFPKGLYRADKKGKLKSHTVQWEVQYQAIDNSDNPTGPWQTLLTLSLTLKTTTPQRKTYSANVTTDRYWVRCRRTNQYSDDYKVGNDLVWEGLRGYVSGGEVNYGNVTLVAMRVRATSNLNDRTRDRFNVIATRKLPIRNSDGTWSSPIATRSIIWAVVDLFKSAYGGKVPSDNFFDWGTLEELDALYASRGDYFDWIFRDSITVWQAATMIAKVGRAVPLLSGSLITMRRDGPLSVPVTLFTPDNIVKGSFQWQIKLWDPNEYDSIAVEYTEPATGYLPEQVLCTLPGDTSDNPEDVRFAGIANRDQAYREGMYLAAVRRYQREVITFETGMEGFIPSYGDLIYIAHDLPSWSQTGYVLAAEEMSTGIYLLKVSEPLRFDSSNPYVILLRGRKAQALGPYVVTATSDPTLIEVMTGTSIDFLTGGTTEPMLFLFGVQNQLQLKAKVVGIEPLGGERVVITAVPYLDVLYTFDGSAPSLVKPNFPETADAPVINQLFLSQVEIVETTIQVSWTAAVGALFYLVEISTDGTTWTRKARTEKTAVLVEVPPGTIYVRVAAVGNGQGPWKQGSIDVGVVFGMSVTIPWDGLEWRVDWWDQLNVTRYNCKVFDDSASLPVLKRDIDVTTLYFHYTYTLAQSDGNLTRYHKLTVDALILSDDVPGLYEPNGNPRSIKLYNVPPPAPLHLAYTHQEDSDGSILLSLTWDNPAAADLVRVKVWLSETDGFDPHLVTPVYDSTAPTPGYANVPEAAIVETLVDSNNVSPNQYCRVAVFDVWGNEILNNVTAQVDVSLPWILAAGQWKSAARWQDTETWNDS